MTRWGCASCQVPRVLSRGGRSSPASASGCDTHRDSMSPCVRLPRAAVPDALAQSIYTSMVSIEGLRPCDFTLPNFPGERSDHQRPPIP
jgi:hypothetical protein|eukprot:COSAG01_NODE_2970_length_6775_cov_8.832235_4_plen_89_part_00